MKLSKRLLALLLALALAFSLALPALAEDPDPAMPIITVQPQGGSIRVDSAFTLSVGAHIPNGDEIGYQWHYYNNNSSGWYVAWVTADITVDYPDAGTYEFSVTVYNRSNPSCKVSSGRVQLEVLEPNPPDVFDPALMPVITAQPQDVRVRRGEPYTISVGASIPNGDPVGYLWYRNNRKSEFWNWRESSASFASAKEDSDFCVEVYNINHPEYRIKSETAHVGIHLTPLDRIQDLVQKVGESIGIFALFSWILGPYFLVYLLAPVLIPILWLRNLFR